VADFDTRGVEHLDLDIGERVGCLGNALLLNGAEMK
jgi:hypothetical protein